MTIYTDVNYLKHLDEYRNLLQTVKGLFIGRSAEIQNYNASINGRIGEITDVRLERGSIYFYVDNSCLSFGPEHLNLI